MRTARLRVVRHGLVDPASGFADPGLSLEGTRQAVAVARTLRSDPPEALRVSPRLRARETAVPISACCGMDRTIAEAYDELPWNGGSNVIHREAEIERLFAGTWSCSGPGYRTWRDLLAEKVLSERGDVLIVTHYVVINVLIGLALGTDDIHVANPAHASITELGLTDGKLFIAR